MQIDPSQRQTIVLHYIERLHTTLTETGVNVNRAYVVQCASCLMTTIVSFGLARSSDLLSIAGWTFYAPQWLIVVGLSIIVAVTFAYLTGLSNHLQRIRKRITELYASIGYSEPQNVKGAAHLLEYPDINSVIADAGLDIKIRFVGTLLRLVNVPILVLTLILFPVMAQVSVVVYLTRSFGWGWLDSTYIASILLITLIHSISFVLGSFA